MLVTDAYDSTFEDFLWQPSKKTIPLEQGNVTSINDCSLPFSVKAYETDHSVYGSVGYVLEGDHSIAYTGDIRLHGARKKLSEDFIENAKSSEVLIIEGTRLSGEDIFDSEKQVRDNCRRAIDISKGIAIADISHRNLERLELFKEVADDTERQLVIAAKDSNSQLALLKKSP